MTCQCLRLVVVTVLVHTEGISDMSMRPCQWTEIVMRLCCCVSFGTAREVAGSHASAPSVIVTLLRQKADTSSMLTRQIRVNVVSVV